VTQLAKQHPSMLKNLAVALLQENLTKSQSYQFKGVCVAMSVIVFVI